jgi:enoyl-CoA hydratase/carnithine racemase
VNAERAKVMGVLCKVVVHEKLMDEARARARRLCLSAPLAVRATKEVAWRGQNMPWVEAIRFGETMRRVAGATDDAREGMTAAREKRTPAWQAK